MSPSRESPSPPSGRGVGGAHGLPVELTSFVGREREIAELNGLLASARLLTLTGAGGSGKSRLALELVERVRGDDAREVAWVELTALEDPAHLARQLAEACGVGEEVRAGDVSQLVALLGTRPILLVLDNCEHLVDACAALAEALLKGCPRLSILATSREALGVGGERAWLVPALSLPPDTADTDAFLESEAVRLFVERAREVVADFRLTPANARAVAEICRRLDGIPLALELAAARVKILPPEQIRARLDDAFRLLTSGSRSRVPRHRTLRAAIDWSHDFLPEEARSLFRWLSVFRGGFSLDAAEAVGARWAREGAEVLDLLSLLVDRSLVSVREQGGIARYHLLETVRQYAAQRLSEAGEEAEARQAHARQVRAVITEAEPHFIRRERKVWVDQLMPGLENIREALAWSRDHDPELHLVVVGKLWWFWYSTRHWTEAGSWIQRALELPEAARPSRERAALLFAAGALAGLQARPLDARPLLEEAVRLAEDVGDGQLAAYALNYLGLTWAGEGSPLGREYCERAARWFEAHDDLYGLRLAYLLQGSAALGSGDLETAERLNLEGVRVARSFGLDRELAVSLQNLATVYLLQKDVDKAEPVLLEALAASRRDPSYYFMSMGLQYMGEVLGHRGRPVDAARILAAATALRTLIGAHPFPLDRARLEEAIPTFREAAGADAFDAAWAEGLRMSPETAVDLLLGGADEAPAEAAPARGSSDAPAPPAAARPPGPDTVPLPGRGAPEPGPAEDEAVPDLRVRALGPLEVEVGGELTAPDAWSYAKPKELLVYLMIHPTGRTREQVGDALWPAATVASVKNSFHVTLHHLRKALGHPEWIVRHGDHYLLLPELTRELDTETFEVGLRGALAARGAGPGDEDVERLRRALALYRGDFMEGQPAARWQEDERDRLWLLHVQGTLALGDALEARGAWAEAAHLYQRLALREELNEEVHRRLMLAWARTGERARALAHYDKLVELLSEAIDAEPEPETVRAIERIRKGTA